MSIGWKVNLCSPRAQVTARLTCLLLPPHLQNKVDEKGRDNQLGKTKGKQKVGGGGGALRGRDMLRG
jgi:hypothetical protein